MKKILTEFLPDISSLIKSLSYNIWDKKMRVILSLFIPIILVLILGNYNSALARERPVLERESRSDCCEACVSPGEGPSPISSPSPSASPSPSPDGTPSPTPTPTPPAGGPGGPDVSPAGGDACPDQAPGPTTLNSVTAAGSGSMVLNWTPADRATHYSISYGVSSGNYTFGVSDTGNVTSFTISGLNPSQTYCFAVRPHNACQPGSLSNEICKLSGAAAISGGQVLGISALAATSSDSAKLQIIISSILGLALIKYGFHLKKTSTI